MDGNSDVNHESQRSLHSREKPFRSIEAADTLEDALVERLTGKQRKQEGIMIGADPNDAKRTILEIPGRHWALAVQKSYGGNIGEVEIFVKGLDLSKGASVLLDLDFDFSNLSLQKMLTSFSDCTSIRLLVPADNVKHVGESADHIIAFLAFVEENVGGGREKLIQKSKAIPPIKNLIDEAHAGQPIRNFFRRT